MIVLPDNGGLSITSATRELAHAWHQRGNQDDTPNQERLSCDQRFFGFVAEWLQQGRTALEDQMLQVFLRHVHGYRTDFLLDLLHAGTIPSRGRSYDRKPLTFWSLGPCGSSLWTEKDGAGIRPDEVACYIITADGLAPVKRKEKVWKV